MSQTSERKNGIIDWVGGVLDVLFSGLLEVLAYGVRFIIEIIGGLSA